MKVGYTNINNFEYLMTRKSKIEKWDLKGEVQRLDKQGKGNKAIANAISHKYADIPELEKISAMSINRYLKKQDENKMEEHMEETKNPTKAIKEEFNNKMRESIQDAESARQTIDKYMNKLEHDNLSAKEVQKIISSWQKINDQYRKNLVSLREFTDNRIIRPTQNIIYKKETNIKNMLLEISRDLCDDCRSKVKKKLKEEKK